MRSPTPILPPVSTQQTMRRATRPAICTAATGPWGLSMTSPLRSFSTEALSISAFMNLPGRYSMRAMRPRTGARFTWQEKTFMNTEMRRSSSLPRPSSFGGTAGPTRETLPSAGLTTSRSSSGVTRGGSRKK